MTTERPIKHLNQIELSRRWSLSPRTLERWRWLGQGPRYLKIGGRVVYRLEDIEAFETQQARESTAQAPLFSTHKQAVGQNNRPGETIRGGL
jgi:hypothetical protein